MFVDIFFSFNHEDKVVLDEQSNDTHHGPVEAFKPKQNRPQQS